MSSLAKRKTTKIRAMPPVLGKVAKATGRKKQPSLPRQEENGGAMPTAKNSTLKGTREDGLLAALKPAIDSGEGCRILIYGRTRYGKSTLAVQLVETSIAHGVADAVCIHDVKYPDRAQYKGAQVSALDQIGPVLSDEPIVVLRSPLTAADGAQAVRALTESGIPAMLLVDENRRAITSDRRWLDQDGPGGPGRGPKNLEWLQLEGGGARASVVLLVQLSRQVPLDGTDSAQVRIVMGLGGGSLNYLVDRRIVPLDAVNTVEGLPPGAFCVFSDEYSWDRRVYYSPL